MLLCILVVVAVVLLFLTFVLNRFDQRERLLVAHLREAGRGRGVWRAARVSGRVLRGRAPGLGLQGRGKQRLLVS